MRYFITFIKCKCLKVEVAYATKIHLYVCNDIKDTHHLKNTLHFCDGIKTQEKGLLMYLRKNTFFTCITIRNQIQVSYLHITPNAREIQGCIVVVQHHLITPLVV